MNEQMDELMDRWMGGFPTKKDEYSVGQSHCYN